LEYSASFLHNYLYYSYVLQLFGLHLFATYILYLALNDHFFLTQGINIPQEMHHNCYNNIITTFTFAENN